MGAIAISYRAANLNVFANAFDGVDMIALASTTPYPMRWQRAPAAALLRIKLEWHEYISLDVPLAAVNRNEHRFGRLTSCSACGARHTLFGKDHYRYARDYERRRRGNAPLLEAPAVKGAALMALRSELLTPDSRSCLCRCAAAKSSG